MYIKKEPNETSLLDILWQDRAENCPGINVPLTEDYRKLEEYLSSLPERDRDNAMFAVCCISAEKQRLAFLEGIRTGIRLQEELSR